MRPGLVRPARVSDPCSLTQGCGGHLVVLTPIERAQYASAHPYAAGYNAALIVGACDVCGLDVIGLKPKAEEETPPSDPATIA